MSNLFSRFNIQDIFDRDPDKFEPHPYRAWAVIFSIGTIIIILALFAHLSLYFYMHTDGSFKSADILITEEARLNRKGLTEVVALFEKKNTEFQSLVASSSQITNPSGAVGRAQASSTPTNKQSSAASPKTTTPKNGTSTVPITVE